MSNELDCETEVKIKGVLVKEPELTYIDVKGRPGEKQAKCSLTFAKKCSGAGEENRKPYWIPVSCFGALAEQTFKLPKGRMTIVVSRINVNRWPDKKGHTDNGGNVLIHTSQNFIAFRVGHQERGLDSPIVWLPGAPRKKKIQGKGEAVTSHDIAEEAGEDSGEPSDSDVAARDADVADFLKTKSANAETEANQEKMPLA